MKKIIFYILILISIESFGQKKVIVDTIDTSRWSIGKPPEWSLQISSPTIYAEFLKDIVRFYDGENLVAYKKKDSSWVLINPNKLRIVLDSVIAINKSLKQ